MEKAGIPVVIMVYPDQGNFFKNVALNNGCPNVRWVAVPRIGQPEEMVATYYDKIIKALTDPLTAKEKESGLYSPPAPPRVLFEGTSDEAQNFLQQTVLIENCRNCPIAKYTDGLPVIIPTEAKVAEMLTGTSHKASEVITNPLGSAASAFGAASEPFTRQVTYAQKYTSTVEKAAVCAVMAGCKPQYMPAVLAIAASGGASTNCPGTSSMVTSLYVVSGPYAKEIGMNAGQESMDIGNMANMTLGRVGSLITVNFGQCITGLVRTDSGNPVHSVCFAEDLDGLPPGWIGLNEESTYYDSTKKATVNYTASQSVIGKMSMGQWFIMNAATYPGYFRTMNTGQMGVARMLGVAGTPGHYNWMEYILPKYIQLNPAVGAVTFILHNNMAALMYEAGFKTKDSIYKWMWDTYFITVAQHYNTGLWEFPYDNGRAIEPTSGKSWNDLLANAPDYKLHALGGSNYKSNCVIMGDSFADEHYYLFPGGRPGALPIDPWK